MVSLGDNPFTQGSTWKAKPGSPGLCQQQRTLGARHLLAQGRLPKLYLSVLQAVWVIESRLSATPTPEERDCSARLSYFFRPWLETSFFHLQPSESLTMKMSPIVLLAPSLSLKIMGVLVKASDC